MKNLSLIKLTFLLMFLQLNMISQTNSIVYTYDGCGNMINRHLTIIPASPGGPNTRFSNPLKTDSLTQLQFKVYPNPTNQYVNIEGDLPQDISEAKILLSNINGQILKTDVYTGQTKTINVEDLKNGMYLLEIDYSKKRKSTYKIIVSN